MSKKLVSLFTIGIGGGMIFYGYNIYNGDYRIYSRHVMPAFLSLYPDPEKSHFLAVKAARYGIVPRIQQNNEIKPILENKLWNINFDNPVGLAAGFDKDGEAINGLSWFGFGFIEVGTTTPEPQFGNPRPRLFRLFKDRAVINRYGFNSFGHDEMERNLKRQEEIIDERNVIVGINLGANSYTENKIEDYVKGLKRFYNLEKVKYFVINISSPNTPNLRNLQNKDQLNDLLESILKEKKILEKQNGEINKPLLIKLSPDLNDNQLNDIAQTMLKYSNSNNLHSKIDGIIISNTTISRPDELKSSKNITKESGGLSGPPLKDLSTKVIGKMYRLTNGSIPIVGVGGIETGLDAYEKIKAGASLVQLYTSLIYFGPPIVREIKYELAYLLSKDGYKNITEAIGVDTKNLK